MTNQSVKILGREIGTCSHSEVVDDSWEVQLYEFAPNRLFEGILPWGLISVDLESGEWRAWKDEGTLLLSKGKLFTLEILSQEIPVKPGDTV